MNGRILGTLFTLHAFLVSTAFAVDKNGVSPQAISLPTGPGSIQGLGESYQPQLNTGAGSYTVKIHLPKATAGIVPELSLSYNTGSPNGPLGVGWHLTGIQSICRNTDEGVPLYVDGPNGLDDDGDGIVDNQQELDTISGVDYEELVRLPDGTFRSENESSFFRYERIGDGWIVRAKNGTRFEFGTSSSTRIEDAGRTFKWLLERAVDKNGNAIEYGYASDPVTPTQKYIRRIRWGRESAFFAAVMTYESGRPDVFTSFRSGFELTTSLRLSQIDIFSQGIPPHPTAERADFDGDGLRDALIRRYKLQYDLAPVSLLARVTHFGADGETSLPALSLDYTSWAPPDNVGATLVRSENAPATAFDSPSVELNDMNGDALPDLLSTSGSNHRVFLNRGVGANGRLRWSPGLPIANAPPIDLESTRSVLMDATADGLSDFVFKSSETRFFCFDNTSELAWRAPDQPLRNTDTFPIWPFDGVNGINSRSIDCDYNRCNDVLFTGASEYRLWMLLPGGVFSKETRLPPLLCDGKVFRFETKGTHVTDLNGDRLRDLAWVQPTRIVYWPSMGRGRFGDPIVLQLGRSLTDSDIERAGFNDIDGDGLVDFTVVRPLSSPTSILYWVNRFAAGLEGPRSVRGLPSQSGSDGIRWADMNGSGSVDIVIAQETSAPGEKVVFVELVPEGKPYLLRRASNGLGLVTTMDYESSADQMVRAADSGNSWSTFMPLTTTIVRRIAEDDGLGTVYDRQLTYRDPFYDANKQEFRGFQKANAHEIGDASAAGKVTTYTYDTGRVASCLKGRILSEEIAGGDGTLFSRRTNTWDHRVLARGEDAKEVCFAFTAATEMEHLEGKPSGVRIRTETEFDDLGNQTAERRFGRLDRSGDEIFVSREYEFREDVWLMDLLERAVTTDGEGNLAAETRYHYDTRGNLERQEQWLDRGDRFVPVLRQLFDTTGNVAEVLDAENRRRTIEYDEFLSAWPIAETVHLEATQQLKLTAEYDLGFGTVTRSRDYADVEKIYDYDALGRLIAERGPGGARVNYEFRLGAPVSTTIKRVVEDATGATFDTFLFSDGYGRSLGEKVETDDERWRYLSAKRFNSRKLVAAAWLPHFTDSPTYEVPAPEASHESMTHDATGRLLQTVRSDGSFSENVYAPLEVTLLDENDTAGSGRPTLQERDGAGRLVKVEERNGDESFVTAYRWSPLNDLVRIEDALGNRKHYTFDSMRRLISVNDPDRGTTLYGYDDTSNRIRRMDAAQQLTLWTYDRAGRILSQDYVDSAANSNDPVDVQFHYDISADAIDFGDGTSGAARNVKGRLAWVKDLSGEEHFSYDSRGNLEWTVKIIDDVDLSVPVAYRTQRLHDLMDREIGVIYPDNDSVRFEYGAGSFISRIVGASGGRALLVDATYTANGQPKTLVGGDGTVTDYSLDVRDRLDIQHTEGADGSELIHFRLTYDRHSNVASVSDLRPFDQVKADSPRRISASFDYDDLHRLTQVTYRLRDDVEVNRGQIEYDYDPLGNLLERSTPPVGSPGHVDDPAVHFGQYDYGGGRANRNGRAAGDGPGPHAVTSSTAGLAYNYDANGNIKSSTKSNLDWDYDNRLVEHRRGSTTATYVYDHSDRRVVKRSDDGRRASETRYINRLFEERAGTPTKYVYHQDRRIAKVSGMLAPQRERVQRVRLPAGWTPVTPAVETGQSAREAFGSDAVFFGQRGTSFTPVSPATRLAFGEPLWVFVPTARVSILKGLYPTTVNSLDPTNTPLKGWPRLEPLYLNRNLVNVDRAFFYDTAKRRWLRRDSTLPSFLSDAPSRVHGATALFASSGIVDAAITASEQVIFYHSDHLTSTACRTDMNGVLLEETAYYPFGTPRHVHRTLDDADSSPEAHYRFTGKERDSESGLVYMSARYYVEALGGFASPDPYYAELAGARPDDEAGQEALKRLLANPQLGNLYAYAARNPLKHVDPDGLEPRISPRLSRDPRFDHVWKVFQKDKVGGFILKKLQRSKIQLEIRNWDGPAITIHKNNKVVIYVSLYQAGKAAESMADKRKDRNFRITLASQLYHQADGALRSVVIQERIDSGQIQSDHFVIQRLQFKGNDLWVHKDPAMWGELPDPREIRRIHKAIIDTMPGKDE